MPGRVSLTEWLSGLDELAARGPDRPAVVDERTRLDRSGLRARVAGLSRALLSADVRPGSPVAVFLDRGADAVAAFLAVLRMGGVYVPVDPAYPRARIEAMLAVGPGAIVTTEGLAERLPGTSAALVFAGRASGKAAPDLPAVPDDTPAYILHTSGTTVAPRAVSVSRGALARYAAALAATFEVDEEDAYLHSASFSFSASTRQLLLPLTAGATLVVADEEARRDPVRLFALMREHGVTIWDTVPSPWRAAERVLSRLPDVTVADSLRRVLLTGEPLSWKLVRAFRRHLLDRVEIWNLYSQTETAGTVSAFRIPRPVPDEAGAVPLGEPLPGIELRVLDTDGRPAKAGETGEILVESDRLADGYFGDAELTATKFAPAGGRRRYRTGDLVRVGPDGTLTPAGRRDGRVKVRGFRVEPAEVEAALREDPLVAEAVVTTGESPAGGTSLIAGVVPADGATPDPATLSDRLRQRVPEHALPGRIVVLHELPMTAHGKLDRSALAAAPPVSSAPPDETEARILPIWEEILGYRPAGVLDDFFERGGDSLIAVSLFVEIEARLGVRLPPATLFEAPNVRGLAGAFRAERNTKRSRSVLELRAGGALPPLFLVHAIWEHLPRFRDLAEHLDPELPVYALEPVGADGDAGKPLDLPALVERYAREVRAIRPRGPVLIAGWSIGGLMAFAVANALRDLGEGPRALMLIDAGGPEVRREKRRREDEAPAGPWSRLRTVLGRQIRALRVGPAEHGRRIAAILRRRVARLRLRIRKPPGHEERERLKQEYRRIVDAFEPRPYEGSATLFRSEEASPDPTREDDLGWREYIRGDLLIVPVRGDHLSLMLEPANLRFLASAMMRCVEESSGPGTAEEASRTADNAAIDLFLTRSKELAGREVAERGPWLSTATADAIRHFSFGICDDNPLWIDEEYARRGPYGRRAAPPTFLAAIQYPILHGAPVVAPLTSLLRDIEFRWDGVILEGEEIRADTEQGAAREVVDDQGQRRIYIDSVARYRRGEEVLGSVRSTVVRLDARATGGVSDREVHRYTPEERDRIVAGIEGEVRTGARRLTAEEASVGAKLPPIVRGPLTIGDMVCWHAGVGPSYRPGPLGYRDTLATPHFTVRHPVFDWPIKFMHQHEDSNLAGQRGMPAPFDNGVMRVAWASVLLTNWMGDHGRLRRLALTIHAPIIYGDACWYSGEVIESRREGERTCVTVRVVGRNQIGGLTTRGEAEVVV